jgi:hypothetical protein
VNELGIRSLVTVLLALGAFGPGSADPAAAAPRLYTGSIEFRISTFDGCTAASSCINDFNAGYPFPFGASISYPSLNNLPSGNLASVSGSGPAAIGLGSDQIALHTSLYDTSPPPSWNVPFAASSFSGGHAAGWLSAGGAPGSTSSSSLTPVPYGRVGVSFSGTPKNFGGTLNLLGSWNARYDSAASLPSYGMPLSPIGGAFGGTARVQLSRIGGTAVSHTVWGFPWTTGSVWVWAPKPSGFGDYSFPYTYHRAAGSDERTSLGVGNIQLVSPFVVRHRLADHPSTAYFQVGIARLSLRFVPEPSRGVLMIAGLAGVGALYRLRSWG